MYVEDASVEIVDAEIWQSRLINFLHLFGHFVQALLKFASEVKN